MYLKKNITFPRSIFRAYAKRLATLLSITNLAGETVAFPILP